MSSCTAGPAPRQPLSSPPLERPHRPCRPLGRPYRPCRPLPALPSSPQACGCRCLVPTHLTSRAWLIAPACGQFLPSSVQPSCSCRLFKAGTATPAQLSTPAVDTSTALCTSTATPAQPCCNAGPDAPAAVPVLSHHGQEKTLRDQTRTGTCTGGSRHTLLCGKRTEVSMMRPWMTRMTRRSFSSE